jgi:hypothetical protein
MKNGILGLVLAVLLVWAPKASPSEAEPETKYSRYLAYWYIGFGIGGGSEIFDFFMAKDTSMHIAPGDSIAGFAFMLKLGAIVTSYLLVGGEFYFLSNGASVFRYFGGSVTYYPLQDRGWYVRGGYNYGGFEYYTGQGDWYGEGEGSGFRLGSGYDFQVSTAFNLGLELSYAGIFDKKGIYSNILFLIVFSWY